MLSKDLQLDIKYDTFTKIFKHINTFKNNKFTPEFLKKLCEVVQELTFAPDELIFKVQIIY